MTCLLLGEGSSDLGVNNDYLEPRFQKGPMTLVIDYLAAKNGVREVEYELLSRGDVSRGIKSNRRQIAARPKEVNQEFRAIFQFALYIGTVARDGQKDAAVYFHDQDRTNSAPTNTAQQLERAMVCGFDMARYQFGVPMIPVPRSEAWLLAYFQKGLGNHQPYNKAEVFEKLPGNDKSPKSAKKLLCRAVGAKVESDVYSNIMEEFSDIDWTRVDMPSYNRFRERLKVVLDACRTMTGNGENRNVPRNSAT